MAQDRGRRNLLGTRLSVSSVDAFHIGTAHGASAARDQDPRIGQEQRYGVIYRRGALKDASVVQVWVTGDHNSTGRYRGV